MKLPTIGCLCGICVFLVFGHPAEGWETRSGLHCAVRWADPAQTEDARAVLDLLEQAHEEIGAALQYTPRRPCRLAVSPSTSFFIQATGKPGWMAAVTGEESIVLQPPSLLRKRGLLAETIRHEYVHVVVRDLSAGRAPTWLHEGLALLMSGEGRRLPPGRAGARPMSLGELEAALQHPHPKAESEALYREAFRRVRDLLDWGGWSRLRELLRSLADGQSSDDALHLVYGRELASMVISPEPAAAP